jgi:hypothetical protein
MSNNSLKSAYRFGGTIFVLSVLLVSTIFGIIFRACSSDNVVNVNLTKENEKSRDTVVIEKSKIIYDSCTKPHVPVIIKTPKPVVINKDTTTKN